MNPQRLAWACRRGMLELDLLLQSFLKRGYPALSVAEKKRFQTLLEASDPELMDWLLHGVKPPAVWRVLIKKIRQKI